MKRLLSKSMLLCCLLSVGMVGYAQKSAKITMFESTLDEGRMNLSGMSPNGKWAALYAGSQLTYYNPTLWNLETGEKVLLLGSEDTETSLIVANDVDDNGMAVGSYGNVPAYFKDGEWKLLPLPEKYATNGEGEARAVSADGSVIVGYISIGIEDEVTGVACKWVNNVLVDVEIPTKDAKGENVFLSQFSDVSADGKIIRGHLNFIDFRLCTPTLWTPEPQTICADLFINEAGEPSYTEMYKVEVMSPNGKYVAGFVSNDVGEQWNEEVGFLYDVQTKETKLYKGENGETLAFGWAVDNNGVIYESPESGSAIRNGYIRVKGIQYDLFEYLLNEYNYDVKAEGLLDMMGTAVAVSDDGKTVVGFEGPGRNWCLKYSDAPGVDPASIESNDANRVVVSMDGKNMMIEGSADNVMVTDLTGKVVLNQAVSGSSVNLSGLPQGIYVATVVASGQNIVTKIALK